nr:RING-H2 finger protein ATL78-like [Ipomoea batatas]
MASSSTLSVEDLLGSFHSRRLLPTHVSGLMAVAAPQASGDGRDPMTAEAVGGNAFDANVVMVLSVLLCALICSLGLNSIIRCALRCSNLVVATGEQQRSGGGDPSARLANTGIKKKALKTFPTISYTNEVKLPGLDSECVICLSEFSPGERVRVLPKCHHGFHVRCIDKWLNSHSSCPTCRHCLIETCQKIVGCAAATPSSSEGSIAIRIEPLPREDIPVEVNWSTAFSTVIKAQSVESESYVMAEEILIQTGHEAALGDEGDNILPTSPPLHPLLGLCKIRETRPTRPTRQPKKRKPTQSETECEIRTAPRYFSADIYSDRVGYLENRSVRISESF